MNELVDVPVLMHAPALRACLIDGEVFVAVKPVCEALGLDAWSQQRKLADKGWATTVKMTVVAADGKDREMLMIDKDSLPMWLATINDKKVSPAVQQILLAYQKEAKGALASYFYTGVAVREQGVEHFENILRSIQEINDDLYSEPDSVIREEFDKFAQEWRVVADQKLSLLKKNLDANEAIIARALRTATEAYESGQNFFLMLQEDISNEINVSQLTVSARLKKFSWTEDANGKVDKSGYGLLYRKSDIMPETGHKMYYYRLNVPE